MKKINLIKFLFLLLPLAACSQQTATNNNPTENTIKPDTAMSDKIEKTEEEWKKILTPEQYHVLRQKGTERPYSGEYYEHKAKGIYSCAACGSELFRSDTKFDAHCGWPSFYKAIDKSKIVEVTDRSHGMIRTEVLCAKCGGHLGHVFDDGPEPTGMRYCINSVSIAFREE
jgi:peptide-methionine (R)-S-oxide reductase